MSGKYLDLAIIIILPLIVFIAVFSFGFQPNYLESLILVFGIPCLYLSLKKRERVKKVLEFSLLISIPVALLVELVAFYDKAWTVPQSTFAFRIFEFLPIENILWQFLTVYTIIIFYEHFCNKISRPGISKKVGTLNLLMYSLTFLVVLLFLGNSTLLHLEYPYLWFCVPFFVIPLILFLWKYPHFFRSFLYTQLFFFYIHTIFEVIGVKLNHWVYTSTHYVGWVSIVGQRFPTEELIFVMIIGAFAACTYYEYFIDDDFERMT